MSSRGIRVVSNGVGFAFRVHMITACCRQAYGVGWGGHAIVADLPLQIEGACRPCVFKDSGELFKHAFPIIWNRMNVPDLDGATR